MLLINDKQDWNQGALGFMLCRHILPVDFSLLLESNTLTLCSLIYALLLSSHVLNIHETEFGSKVLLHSHFIPSFLINA